MDRTWRFSSREVPWAINYLVPDIQGVEPGVAVARIKLEVLAVLEDVGAMIQEQRESTPAHREKTDFLDAGIHQARPEVLLCQTEQEDLVFKQVVGEVR